MIESIRDIDMNKITLALGGGGTKGFAHIGVIRQLEREGYQIEAIAGTSAGGIVGALYAYGYTVKEIIEFSRNLNFSDIFHRLPNDPPSLLGLGGLTKRLKDVFGEATFNDLKIKFASVSVDIDSGNLIIMNKGKLVDAVKATTAVPGIFPSKEMAGLNLVDGGVLDPVPVTTARWLYPDAPVIAVSLIPPMNEWSKMERLNIPPFMPIPQFVVDQLNQLRLGQAMHIFINSMEIMMNMITDLRLTIDKPDIIIRPKVYHHTMFDEVDIDQMVRLGEEAVREKLPELRNLFSSRKRVNRWFKVAKKPGKPISDIEPGRKV